MKLHGPAMVPETEKFIGYQLMYIAVTPENIFGLAVSISQRLLRFSVSKAIKF